MVLPVKVEKGKTHRVSIYVKAKGVKPGQTVSLTLNWLGSSGAIINGAGLTSLLEIKVEDTDWMLIALEGVALGNCRARLQVG